MKVKVDVLVWATGARAILREKNVSSEVLLLSRKGRLLLNLLIVRLVGRLPCHSYAEGIIADHLCHNTALERSGRLRVSPAYSSPDLRMDNSSLKSL